MNPPKKVLLLALASTILSTSAFAQNPIDAAKEAEAKEKADAEAKDKPKDGWTVGAKLGLTGSLINSKNVVGAAEGTAVSFGGVFGANATWRGGQHAWANDLGIQLTETKLPGDVTYLKSTDIFDLKSMYTYRFLSPEWMGLFGQFKLASALLPGNDANGFNFIGVDGVPDPDRAPDDFSTTGFFEPMLLQESAGLFFHPYETARFDFRGRVGAGSQQTLNRGGFVVVDTENLIAQKLQSSIDVGAGLGLDAKGFLVKDLLTWFAGANFYMPFVTTADPVVVLADDGTPTNETIDLVFVDGLNTELTAGLSAKIVKWLSLDYVFLARRAPSVILKWQVTNTFLLSASFDVI